MYQGKIIEYIDRGDFHIALCIQDEVTRLHLLTPANREANLPAKRALLVSASALNTQAPRAELLQKLKHAEATRMALKGEVNAEELWELLKDEDESYDHAYLAQLAFGDHITDAHVSAVVRALFEDKVHFKMKESLFFPNTQERVEQILKQMEEEALKEKRMGEGSAWLKSALGDGHGEPPACKEEIVRALVDLVLYEEETPDAKFGKELLQRAGGYDASEARRILVKLGVWDEDENLDLLRFEIPTFFSAEAIEESENLSQSVLNTESREDLRNLDLFTVDGALTRDFDDALSCEVDGDTFNVGVHIADVANLVKPDGPLDREASQRGSSVYLPCRQIPMLPPVLSQEVLSLKEGHDRGALSLLARLDRQGNLLDFRLVPSLVRVRMRYTYDEVNAQHLEHEPFRILGELSRILRRKRLEAGALLLTLPELAIRFEEGGAVFVEKVDQDTPSRVMVAEFMILYNRLAGRFAREHKIPVLFRSQEGPSERLSAEDLDYVYYVFKQRRKLTPLTIDTQAKGHSGLGVDVYTQVSSPIRRYLDLLAQRQLRSFLLTGTPEYTQEELDQKRMSLETTLRNLDRMIRNRTRYWLYKYLLQHEGEQFPAMVLDVMRNRVRLLLTDLLLVVEMKKEDGQAFTEGQKLQVRIKKSNPWQDVLKVEYTGNP